LVLFPNSYTILFWESNFLPFSVHVQINVGCLTRKKMNGQNSVRNRFWFEPGLPKNMPRALQLHKPLRFYCKYDCNCNFDSRKRWYRITGDGFPL
jgi:hypothetical protein